ncbi:methionine/alanine import NSS transporter subunit MetS [Corynebacterium hindlerae]|uniref:methionine/alanine import NSS transporter subunit MetS n=1 Tax=Corynebacterium hindlerae TaxID=699041 RepID=UPI001AD7782B|nr:methionine/alanine import NSS transporter subunit MetS [Corynebacterium hindlerae]QTH60668.1 methionine/alanine import NSS transporter subunit MetS [Corynebacterium hindlerae]
MSGSAIMMMVLFIAIIWGGLAASIAALRRAPDDQVGVLGPSEHATDEVLIGHELEES